MREYVLPKRSRRKLTSARDHMAAQVPSNEPGRQIDECGYDQEPCRQKVQAPRPAVLVEDIVRARLTDDRGRSRSRSWEERQGLCPPAMVVVAADREFEERRGQIVSHRAPVESRMRHQDYEPGDGEREH